MARIRVTAFGIYAQVSHYTSAICAVTLRDRQLRVALVAPLSEL